MTPNTKRVFCVNHPPHPVFDEILARRPDLQLDRLVNDSPDHLAEPILAAAHVYQIGATRDELAQQYHGTADLLARTPNLLVDLLQRRRLRHGRREACTRPASRW